jgi:ATP phosphoribosyltransferase
MVIRLRFFWTILLFLTSSMRRIATRYANLARNFIAAAQLTATISR